MITNLQTYFQKHYRWMFTFLLVIIVIPFVFAYGPGSRLANARQHTGGEVKNFFGHNLADEAHVQELSRCAAISAWLKTGNPPYDQNALQALILERIVELNLADRLGIPSPTSEELTAYIAILPAFQAGGAFSKEKFNEFNDRFVKEENTSKEFLMDRIVERWRLDQLSGRLEGACFYLPTTLEREYSLVNTKYSTQVAIYKLTPDQTLSLTDTEAKTYFDAHKAAYNMEEKREGTIYRLKGDKFVAQAPTPTEEQLQKFFDSVSMRFIQWQVKDEKGNITGPAEPKAPTLAEHREETIKLYKQMKAARSAAEIVDAVVQKIYADKIAPGSKAWDELVKASGLEALAIAPTAQSSGNLDEQTQEALFSRSLTSQAYSEAFQTEEDGRFVLLTKVCPSAPQAYEAVATKVKADALLAKQQKDSQEKLAAKVKALKEAVKIEPFIEAAIKLGFITSTPEPFTLMKPDVTIGTEALLKALVSAKIGEIVSDEDGQQATVVLLKERQGPVFDLKGEAAQKLKNQMDQVYRSMGTLSFLNEWAQMHGKD